jgi:DNA end-binding protein Ku
MPHSTWKGYLRLSLVSVPVRAFSANVASAKVHLNQLHEDCHSRIRYQKTCPVHGEVTKDEIVSGYEYAKDQYVVIEPEELAELRGEREKAINIEAVVSRETIDRLHCTERSYYLLPDGKAGEKPYVLLQHCLAEGGLEAVCRGVMFSREELMLLRPVENLLAVTALKFDAEVAATDDLGETVKEPALNREEVALTKTLLEAYLKEDFSLSEFKDRYLEDLARLIQAKVEGKEVVKPPTAEVPQVINLMDALKKSLATTGGSRAAGAKSAGPKPARRKARRKSG